MALTLSTTVRRASLAVLLVATGGVLGIGTPAVATTHPATAPGASQPTHHAPSYDQRPITAGSDYLALGDSVAFGYREPANLPTPDYADAASFAGYPENVAGELGVHVSNPSCPGETSASLIDSSARSYACETDASGTGPGYRTAYPLHVSYRGSQLSYAVHYLQRHRHTRLVSLMIGANDGFLCQATTSDHCASELPSVLAKVSANVRTILKTVRRAGHYRGQIAIVNYYSTDYTSATQNASSQGLNRAMDSAAKPFHVRIADGYATFQKAAAQAGGDTCKAGLLTTLTTGGCGVHPSVAGQELLAAAVERAVHRR